MKKLKRFIRILEYTGTEEFIENAIKLRSVKQSRVTKAGYIKEAISGDFFETVNLLDEIQPTAPYKNHYVCKYPLDSLVVTNLDPKPKVVQSIKITNSGIFYKVSNIDYLIAEEQLNTVNKEFKND